MSFHEIILTRTATDDQGKEVVIPIEAAVHPSESGVLVLFYPGHGGTLAGPNDEFERLCDFLQEHIGAAVRSNNVARPGFDYMRSVKEDFRFVLEYALAHSAEICRSKDPVLYLAGFSAGAGAVAALAAEYDVQKILLYAPSTDAGRIAIREGMAEYRGETYIIIGEDDEVVGSDTGALFYEMAQGKKELALVPGCDHAFTRVPLWREAAIWAFKEGQAADAGAA